MRDTQHIRIEKIAKEIGQGKVLDIGCGKCELKKYLNEAVEYIGIDLSKTQKCVIKHNLNKGTLPFRSGEFDYVICSEVLEHLFEPQKILKEIARCLKVDGAAIISLPNEHNFWLRIKFFLGIENDLWVPFKQDGKQHLHLPNVKQARDFISSQFKIVKEIPTWTMGQHLNFLVPVFLFLCKIHPNLFARAVIFVCKKR